MYLILLLNAHPYPIAFVLASSLLVAAVDVGLVVALDYRTWRWHRKRVSTRQRRERNLHRNIERTGSIYFLFVMMLLVMVMALVLVVDVIDD